MSVARPRFPCAPSIQLGTRSRQREGRCKSHVQHKGAHWPTGATSETFISCLVVVIGLTCRGCKFPMCALLPRTSSLQQRLQAVLVPYLIAFQRLQAAYVHNSSNSILLLALCS